MPQRLIILGGLFVLGAILSWLGCQSSPVCEGLQLTQTSHTQYDLMVVKVTPSERLTVRPGLASGLMRVDQFAAKIPGVQAVINAGFFDPNNQLSSSYVQVDGEITADPTKNDRMMGNPDLKPYLPAMLSRSAFRTIQCPSAQENDRMRYDIAPVNQLPPEGCEIIDLLQAGPDLFDPQSAEREAFIALKDGHRVRDPIGVDGLNARSAVGLTAQGEVLLVMVGMKAQPERTGVSLKQLAQIMRDLGAVQALNLDGGSSSSLWVKGQTHYGKRNPQGKLVQRPVKSVLAVVAAPR